MVTSNHSYSNLYGFFFYLMKRCSTSIKCGQEKGEQGEQIGAERERRCHCRFHQNQLGFSAWGAAALKYLPVEWKIAIFSLLATLPLFPCFFSAVTSIFHHAMLLYSFPFFSIFCKLQQLAKWYVKMTVDEIDDVSFASASASTAGAGAGHEMMMMMLLRLLLLLSDVPWQIDTLLREMNWNVADFDLSSSKLRGFLTFTVTQLNLCGPELPQLMQFQLTGVSNVISAGIRRVIRCVYAFICPSHACRTFSTC